MADHNLGNDVEITDEGMLSIDEGMLSVENSGTQVGLKKLSILMASTAALLTAACSAQEAEVRQVSAGDERQPPTALAANETEPAPTTADGQLDLAAMLEAQRARGGTTAEEVMTAKAETARERAETAWARAETERERAETEFARVLEARTEAALKDD